MNILMVCMGNICRSPIAEGLLRNKLQAAGLARRVRVDSAGTGGWHAGMSPDRRAVEVCQEFGIAIGDQRARQITQSDFRAFEWLLCADRVNLRQVQALATPAERSRTALLLEWSGLGEQVEVPDPYYGTIEDFRAVFRLLDRATDAMLTKLQQTA